MRPCAFWVEKKKPFRFFLDRLETWDRDSRHPENPRFLLLLGPIRSRPEGSLLRRADMSDHDYY